MGILLGLLSSFAFGVGDFMGGLLARRATALSVVLASQATGLLMAIPMVLLVGADREWEGVAWGSAAGVGVGLGVVLLYRSLAIGRMTVAAPVTSVVVAILPTLAGFVSGERPAPIAVVGIVVAIAAVVLIATTQRAETPVAEVPARPGGSEAADGPPPPRVPGAGGSRPGRTSVDRGRGVVAALPPGLLEALAAGLCLGGARVLLDGAPDVSGLWPAGASRLSGTVILGLLALGTRAPVRLPTGAWPIVLVLGFLEAGAGALFLLATTQGLLAIVSVLASLYPVITVVLARVFLHERLSRMQLFGVALALVGIVLIALP